MAKVAYDAVVVGSGPNGLAAAIRLAQAGLSVLVVEANDTVGGGLRSAELTLPGFLHDVCSAIHPLALGSPFLRTLPLEKYGLKWIHPELPLAHPLPDAQVALLRRSLAETSQGLGRDRLAYERLMAGFVRNWEVLIEEILRPLVHLPKNPIVLARFGWQGIRGARTLAKKRFSAEPARALFGGLAAHSFLELESLGSAAFGLMLALLGHAVGWPLPQGGSQKLADALAAHFRSLGGEITTGLRVETLEQLPLSRATLLDLTPRPVLRILGERLPPSCRRAFERYRYGPGVFKVDYALARPIPWSATECRGAGTVHVCGTLDEVAAAEREVAEGRAPSRPFVLLAQPSLFDSTRAPNGQHTAWAYCHVPNGSTFDMLDRLEAQIERFAPGFRDCILARYASHCQDLERKNANLIGGDINGGAADLWQLIARPRLSSNPYRIPVPGLYLCSSSTPPGGGVHGMCGVQAAETALRDCFGGIRAKRFAGD
jgi:phytoene dehydrogenase-like protein